jgi:hypothetical protein
MGLLVVNDGNTFLIVFSQELEHAVEESSIRKEVSMEEGKIFLKRILSEGVGFGLDKSRGPAKSIHEVEHSYRT